MKNNTTLVNNNLSIDYCQVLCLRTSTTDSEPSACSTEVAALKKLKKFLVVLADRRSRRDPLSPRNIPWLNGFDNEWVFGYEKVIREMGEAFTHNWLQTYRVTTSTEYWAMFNWRFDHFWFRGRNICSPQHTGDWAVVEGWGESVTQRSHGGSFLECERFNSHPLSSKRTNDNWRIFCKFIGLVQRGCWELTTALNREEKTLPPR